LRRRWAVWAECRGSSDCPVGPASRQEVWYGFRGFERHFGFEAPPDVTDVYYFADEMGVDVLYQLGFEAGPETVTRIVKELDLTQSTSASDGPSPDLAYEFPWWDEQDVQRATRYWKSNAGHDYWWALW